MHTVDALKAAIRMMRREVATIRRLANCPCGAPNELKFAVHMVSRTLSDLGVADADALIERALEHVRKAPSA
jgi:hypothetical protein